LRIDVPGADKWRLISEVFRNSLPFQEPAVYVQAYLGFQHALYEAAHGLARLFSHKKTIAVVGAIEPAIDSIIIGFSEEGYTIKQFAPEDADDVSTWLPVLQNELAFVLFVEDNSVTGEIYDHAKFHAALKDKRIFRLSVSHASYREQAIARPQPFETRILSLRPDMAVLVAGERFRMTPILAARLSWSSEAAALAASQLVALGSEDIESKRSTVVSLEQNLPAGFKAYLSGAKSRTSDRAVFFHEEMDGSAVIDEVARLAGQVIAAPGSDGVLESSSSCRWSQPRFAEWLTRQGMSAEAIRGLIMIDSSWIQQVGVEQFASYLKTAAENILKIQNP